MTPKPAPVGWREPAAAGALASVGVLALSWPAFRHPLDWIIGASHNDGHAILWGLDHVAGHLARGQWPPLHTDALFFPEGGTMVVSNLLEVVALAPVTLAWGAVAAFNLWTVLHHALAAAAAWWCVRRHGADPIGAAVAALAFTFAPVMAGTTFNENPDVTSWYWVPLVAGLAWRAPSARAIVAAGAAAGMAAWSNPYCGVMAGLAWVLLTPKYPVRRWLAGLATGLAVGTSAYLLYRHGAITEDSLTTKAVRDNVTHGVASLADLVTRSPTFLNQDSTWSAALHAHYPYLGWALVIVGGAALLRLRHHRWTVLALASALLAMGPEFIGIDAPTRSPVAWLEQFTPLGRLHLSHRYTALTVFSLAFSTAIWMRTWTARWRAAVLAAVCLDFIQPIASSTLYRPSAPYEDGACALLAELPPGPVFDIPGERGEQWLFAATCHRRPIAAGLNRAMSPPLLKRMHATPPDQRLALLSTEGFRYVVVHARSPRRELARFPELATLGAPCEVARNRARVRVLDLHDCPAAQTSPSRDKTR